MEKLLGKLDPASFLATMVEAILSKTPVKSSTVPISSASLRIMLARRICISSGICVRLLAGLRLSVCNRFNIIYRLRILF